MKLGFLASNSGSSLRAIVAAIEAGNLFAEARLVVSNKPGAPALAFATAHGIPTRVIPTVKSPDRADEDLAMALNDAGVEFVILSGYLRKLGPRTLAAYRNRILNIHPALLPRHGGPGMYGRRVHEAVLGAGDPVSGATVHLVDEEYDHGEAIARVEVPVLPGDEAADLESRVMAAEPKLFVETLQRLAGGTLWFPERS
jgi:phosphoribosylglycinamide formyltransferase-1